MNYLSGLRRYDEISYDKSFRRDCRIKRIVSVFFRPESVQNIPVPYNSSYRIFLKMTKLFLICFMIHYMELISIKESDVDRFCLRTKPLRRSDFQVIF